MKNIMYSTPSCPFCNMAKKLLDKKGISYEVIDVSRSAGEWQAMEEKTGRNTVPQIYIGHAHVGGFDDLSAANANGTLDKLLLA